MARVMIVDDSMFMRQVLRNILSKAGHEVVGEAESGEKCLAEAPKMKPDLVTLDLVMPGMGGMECLKGLRKSHPNTRVVIVSAIGQQSEIAQAVALGASDYLVKPFDESAVTKTITAVMK
jgi:two-component system chemotaxis response regulator CheY